MISEGRPAGFLFCAWIPVLKSEVLRDEEQVLCSDLYGQLVQVKQVIVVHGPGDL